MGLTDSKDIEYLLKNIQKGLKLYSIKELNRAIIEALNKKDNKKDEIDFVLDIVARNYAISLRSLQKENARGIEQDAKQMVYCLLYFNLGLSMRYISSKVFMCWPTSVLKGIKRYRTANPAIKQDSEFLNTYNKLQKELLTYITTKNK